MLTVAVIVGSLRKDSINRKLAQALDKLKAPDLQLKLIKIDDIPLYNQDNENPLPAAVDRMKKEIAAADAILFVTPEYNRSIPGVLKNIIDWGTRPYGKNVWAHKPFGVIGISPSAVGTAVAQAHLRTILSGLTAIFVGHPEVYLVDKEGMIDSQLNITVDATKQFLQTFLETFAQGIKKHK